MGVGHPDARGTRSLGVLPYRFCALTPRVAVALLAAVLLRGLFFFFCLLHDCLIGIVPTLCCGARFVVCTPPLPGTLPFCPSPVRCRVSVDAGKGHKLPSGPTGGLVGRRRCGRAADGARRVPPPARGLPAAAGRLPAAGLPAAAAAGRVRRAAARLPHHRGGAAAAGRLPAAAATAGLRRRPGAGVCEPAGAAAAKGQLDAAGVLFGAGRLVRWRDPYFCFIASMGGF